MLRLILIIGVTIVLLMAGVASARAPGRAAMMPRPMMERQMARVPAPTRQEGMRTPENAPAPRASPVPADPARGEPQQRNGRMTPEERKALRRQIDEARDFYRPFPQRRP